MIQAGPQREIFPGGTKVDAGPPKSLRAPKLHKILYSDFFQTKDQKLGEEQKKKGLH